MAGMALIPVLAHGVYDAHTLTKRHKMWGEFWAERGYVALHVDGFGPRGYPAGFAKGTYSDRPEELNEVTIRPFDAYGALRYLRTRNDVAGRSNRPARMVEWRQRDPFIHGSQHARYEQPHA